MTEMLMMSVSDITLAFRLIFVAFGAFAILFLTYLMKKHPERRGFGVYALIYFSLVFLFYLLRFFDLPRSYETANIFSNIIRLVGSIFIFYTAYELITDGKYSK